MARDFLCTLNKKVRFYSVLEDADVFGEVKSTEKEIGVGWCFVDVMNTSYWYDYGKKNNAIVYKIIGRHLPQLVIGCYLDFDGHKIEVQSIKDVYLDDVLTFEAVGIERLEVAPA